MNIICSLVRAVLRVALAPCLGHDVDRPLTVLDVLETDNECLEGDEPVDYWPAEEIPGVYECPICSELMSCHLAVKGEVRDD